MVSNVNTMMITGYFASWLESLIIHVLVVIYVLILREFIT